MPRLWTDPRAHLLGAALALLLSGLPAQAQDFGLGRPAAANDWLSGHRPPPPPISSWRPGDPTPPEAARRRPVAPVPPPVARPHLPVIATPGHAPGNWRAQARGAAVATSAAVPAVGVTRLSDGNPDLKGALPADHANLPRDLWGTASGAEIADRIAATQPRLAATRNLFRRILTAQLTPPAGNAAGSEGRLFLARADRLIALGWIDDAEALLQSAGAGDGPRFARRFDVALIRGDAGSVCRAITDRPGLAPGLAAQVYCLAQDGDWAAAAVTLHGARDGGLIAPQTVALLERFLDDSTADLSETLPAPDAVTPLDFRLFEAIGQPLATQGLPLAYAWTDLNGEAGWKARIEAAERLTRASAAPASVLAEAYMAQRPAASGGIWDRAAAYQQLDLALTAQDDAALATALPAAEQLFAQAGLLVPLAQQIAPRLPAAGLTAQAAETAAHLRLLAGIAIPDSAALPPADAALARIQNGAARDTGGSTAGGSSVAPETAGDSATSPPGAAPARTVTDGNTVSAAPQPTDAAVPNPDTDAEGRAGLDNLATDGAKAPSVDMNPTSPPGQDHPSGTAPRSARLTEEFPAGGPVAAYTAALEAAPLDGPPPEGRGLALLAAMQDVDTGLSGDTTRAAAGLRRMVELGQPADARRAAVELLLIEHLGGLRQ